MLLLKFNSEKGRNRFPTEDEATCPADLVKGAKLISVGGENDRCSAVPHATSPYTSQTLYHVLVKPLCILVFSNILFQRSGPVRSL